MFFSAVAHENIVVRFICWALLTKNIDIHKNRIDEYGYFLLEQTKNENVVCYSAYMYTTRLYIHRITKYHRVRYVWGTYTFLWLFFFICSCICVCRTNKSFNEHRTPVMSIYASIC